MKTMLTRGFAILLLAAAPLAGAIGRSRLPTRRLVQIARVGGGTLSPDGNTLAFTVTTVHRGQGRAPHRSLDPAGLGRPVASHDGAGVREHGAALVRRRQDALLHVDAPRQQGNHVGRAHGRRRRSVPGRGPGGGGSRGWSRRSRRRWSRRRRRCAARSRPTRASRSRRAAAQPAARAGGRRAVAVDAAATTSRRRSAPRIRTIRTRRWARSRVRRRARSPSRSIAARFDGRHFIDERTRSNDAGFVAEHGSRHGRGAPTDSTRAVAAVDAAVAARSCRRPAPRRCSSSFSAATGDRKQLTNTNYTHFAPSVSPDGKWVVFGADAKLRSDSLVARERDSVAKLPHNRARDEADRNDTDLYILPVAECEAGNAAACKPKKVEYFGSETNIIWSADSKQFAFVGRPGQFSSSRLMLASVDGGKAVDILGAWKYEPGNIEWFKDGKIRMTTTTGGARGLWQVDPATKADLADPRRTPAK